MGTQVPCSPASSTWKPLEGGVQQICHLLSQSAKPGANQAEGGLIFPLYDSCDCVARGAGGQNRRLMRTSREDRIGIEPASPRLGDRLHFLRVRGIVQPGEQFRRNLGALAMDDPIPEAPLVNCGDDPFKPGRAFRMPPGLMVEKPRIVVKEGHPIISRS